MIPVIGSWVEFAEGGGGGKRSVVRFGIRGSRAIDEGSRLEPKFRKITPIICLIQISFRFISVVKSFRILKKIEK